MPSFIHVLFSKSFTNISYFTPDVNSNFKKITFLKLSSNYPTRFMPILEFNYQNNYQHSHFYTSHIYQIAHFILCVYPRKQDSCVRRMQGYICSQLQLIFVHVYLDLIILIVSSLPLFVCLRVQRAGLNLHTYRNAGFMGQCDETSIYLLHTRIQGLQDWNNY